MRAAVERKIGRPLSDVERADIVIEGHETTRTADRVSARVTQRAHDGTRLGSRTIDARDCEGLQQAATLVVALIVQADQDEGQAGSVIEPPVGEHDVPLGEPPPPAFPEPPLAPLPSSSPHARPQSRRREHRSDVTSSCRSVSASRQARGSCLRSPARSADMPD
ncbi:hypothetical protein AKJ09_01347 [Labilithrix luteola]|uniref:Uncharacterized protein n=1 Tax=Labilithrix luteola TaxID=1391654 RepID=A0A0K1PMB7_9BACT|nr:hypothetical protein AKJ09_01347 [Labilithrix luteola]